MVVIMCVCCCRYRVWSCCISVMKYCVRKCVSQWLVCCLWCVGSEVMCYEGWYWLGCGFECCFYLFLLGDGVYCVVVGGGEGSCDVGIVCCCEGIVFGYQLGYEGFVKIVFCICCIQCLYWIGGDYLVFFVGSYIVVFMVQFEGYQFYIVIQQVIDDGVLVIEFSQY